MVLGTAFDESEMAMREETQLTTTKNRVTFKVGDLLLEGVLHSFHETGPMPAVVVCHPHPLYGGTMYNNVVIEVCQELNRKGIVALRFNFRGVGSSQGQYGRGVAEIEDVMAAVSFVSSLPNVDPNMVGLAGYSFGAIVCVSAAVADDRVKAVAAISLPVTLEDFSFLRRYDRPRMFIVGALDSLAPARQLEEFVLGLPEPKRFEQVARADHLWHGFERLVASTVANFFVEHLTPAAPE